jgi:CheY-like chemotaxis protein
MRVLIIEDTADNMYLMRYLLETEGHEVGEATTGGAGIEMAGQGGWTVILLDIQLPELDGYQVVARLKAMPRLAGTPVIAVTSFAMAGDREKALAAGFDSHLEKPIRPETFVSEIQAVVEGGHAADSRCR